MYVIIKYRKLWNIYFLNNDFITQPYTMDCLKNITERPPMRIFFLSNRAHFKNIWLGGVHKLRWHVFGFFWPQVLASVDIFYLINVDKKLTFLDYLPTSSCQCSLWMPPYNSSMAYCLWLPYACHYNPLFVINSSQL